MTRAKLGREEYINQLKGYHYILDNQSKVIEHNYFRIKNKKLEEKLDAAVARDDLEKVKSLINQGAEIENRDQFGNTALMCAAWSACINVLSYLIEIGATIDNKDNEGIVPNV